MMTQSVMTQAANLFANTTGGVTPKGKQTGSGFDFVINNNLKSQKSTTGNTETVTSKKLTTKKTDTVVTAGSDDADSVNQTDDKQTKTATATDEATTKKTDNTKTEGSKAAQQTKDAKEEGNVSVNEQLMGEIVGMLQNIQATVMEALNLTPEELEKLLQEQGMSITDLLQPESLQQLVLANNGTTDITAVLTDEKLAATMKDLLQTVEGIKTDANLQLTKEQINSFLTQAEELAKLQSQEETAPTSAILNETPVSEEKQKKQSEVSNTTVTAAKMEETVLSETDSSKDNLMQTAKTEGIAPSNADTQNDTSNNDNKDMQSTDPFQVFIDNLVKTSKETQVNFSGNMVQATQLRDIANQIIDRIRVTVTTSQSSMELQLNPENLGKVNLTVQSKNGVLTAQFVVQNEVSKEAIESQLHTLRETLNSQGVKVEAIEVTVSTYAFEQNSGDGSENQADTQKDNSGKKITLEDALNMTETPDLESDTQNSNDILGSQIDYTA